MFALTRTVLLLARSLTNTFRFGPGTVFVTRFFALLTNAMKRPSVLKMGVKELPAPVTLVRSVVEMGRNDPAASENEFPSISRAARHNEQRKLMIIRFVELRSQQMKATVVILDGAF